MFPVDSFRETLEKAVRIFQRFGIRFHLTGGIASVYYGEPRLTQEIDVVIDNAQMGAQLDSVLRSLSESDFIHDPNSVRIAVAEQGMLQLLDRVESLKLDICARELTPGELDRSVSQEALTIPIDQGLRKRTMKYRIVYIIPLMFLQLLCAVPLQAQQLKLGELKLIYTEDEIPIRYDGSLSTLRQDGEMHFFHSFGCRIEPGPNRRSRHSWHKGTPEDPLKCHVGSKTEEAFWDYNGYYQDLVEEGIWILGMYECPGGDLLAITHAELNAGRNGKLNRADQRFALGLGYSTDRGRSWTYCGEILRPADDRQNVGGGAYIIRDDYLYVYFNDVIPGDTRARRKPVQCVARANLDAVIQAAAKHEVIPWHKYGDGKWDIPGLSGGPGEDLIPHIVGGEDLHADAAYCTALEKYLLAVHTHTAGKLLLFSSSDGLDWSLETIVDEIRSGAIQPYSAFVDFNGPSADCHTVDEDFYIYFPHKGPDHDHDDMYRRKITVE